MKKLISTLLTIMFVLTPIFSLGADEGFLNSNQTTANVVDTDPLLKNQAETQITDIVELVNETEITDKSDIIDEKETTDEIGSIDENKDQNKSNETEDSGSSIVDSTLKNPSSNEPSLENTNTEDLDEDNSFFHISFDLNEGTSQEIPSIEVIENTLLTQPETPKKEGCIFYRLVE